MLPTDVSGWMIDILTFVYFSCKDFLLSKVFKNTTLKVHPAFSIIMALIGLYVNSQLQNSYAEYLDMSYIKGSIKLPPFPLLFLLVDLISSLALIILMYIRIGSSFFTQPFARISMDVLRFIFIYTVFTNILSSLWLPQLTKQANWDYTCFRNQLVIDAAVYYYRNNEMPHALSDFTTIKTNPANNSPLLFTRGNGVNITVTDNAGNVLVSGYKDFIGLTTYTVHPEDFFTTRRIMNKNLCNGSLIIPSEYDQEPSWRK